MSSSCFPNDEASWTERGDAAQALLAFVCAGRFATFTTCRDDRL